MAYFTTYGCLFASQCQQPAHVLTALFLPKISLLEEVAHIRVMISDTISISPLMLKCDYCGLPPCAATVQPEDHLLLRSHYAGLSGEVFTHIEVPHLYATEFYILPLACLHFFRTPPRRTGLLLVVAFLPLPLTLMVFGRPVFP